jgi:hypothetical protein
MQAEYYSSNKNKYTHYAINDYSTYRIFNGCRVFCLLE